MDLLHTRVLVIQEHFPNLVITVRQLFCLTNSLQTIRRTTTGAKSNTYQLLSEVFHLDAHVLRNVVTPDSQALVSFVVQGALLDEVDNSSEAGVLQPLRNDDTALSNQRKRLQTTFPMGR